MTAPGSPSSGAGRGGPRWRSSSPGASRSSSSPDRPRPPRGSRADRANDRRLPGIPFPARLEVARGPGRPRRGRARRLRRPVEPPAPEVERVARVDPAVGGPRLGRQGPRARHAPPDERGHRRGGRVRSRPDRRAVGPEPRPRDRPRACRPRRSSRPTTRRSPRRIQARLGRRRFRLYVNSDIVGVELCGALKNVVAIAAGAADELGFGDNGKAGPDDPRPGRDDPPRDRRRREPADVRRPGRDRRRHRDLRLAAVAQPPARRRARQGPSLGRHRGRACRASPRAPTRSMRRSPWPTGSASRCRSPARSTAPCSRARASSAASSTCSPASRRTSWPTTGAGWPRSSGPEPDRLLDSGPRRGVAQSGSAPVWGTGGRRFKSGRPDHFCRTKAGPERLVRPGPDRSSDRSFRLSGIELRSAVSHSLGLVGFLLLPGRPEVAAWHRPGGLRAIAG